MKILADEACGEATSKFSNCDFHAKRLVDMKSAARERSRFDMTIPPHQVSAPAMGFRIGRAQGVRGCRAK
jgi:hypothetical protein